MFKQLATATNLEVLVAKRDKLNQSIAETGERALENLSAKKASLELQIRSVDLEKSRIRAILNQ